MTAIERRNPGAAILVCDSRDRLAVLRRVLNSHHIETLDAEDGASALRVAKRTQADYVFTCEALTDSSGLKLISRLKHRYPTIFGVIVGPGVPLKVRREVLDAGADDYIEVSADEASVNTSIRRLTARKELGILGRDEKILQAIEIVESIARTKVTVLVTGESGTGKELIARAIHLKSDRSSGPFVAVNCGALPEGVLESELFGHEKGAFTGATALRKGRFEIADGGTLLLDEVGEMPQSTQVKLLRVLEEERFMRVGGSQDVKVDARVIAASNRDLREDVESSLFRRDLYYRLNVVHIHVPPLRERRGDIPTIFLGLAEEAASRNALRFGGITGDALEVMERYEWPGNVRELRNLAESLVVISKGRRVGVNDLPEHILRPGASSAHLPVVAGRPRHEMELRLVMTGLARIEDRLMDLKDLILGRKGGLPPDSRVLGEEIPSGIVHFKEVPQGGEIVVEPGTPLRDVERELIRTTLAAVGGNRKKAARLLGMGERTLYRRMKEYDIS